MNKRYTVENITGVRGRHATKDAAIDEANRFAATSRKWNYMVVDTQDGREIVHVAKPQGR